MHATPRRVRRPLVGALVFVATLVVGVTAAQAAPLLPDLDPSAPGRPRPTAIGAQVYLTFGATFANVGAGPLVLRGHRGSTAEPTMVADQVVTAARSPGGGGDDHRKADQPHAVAHSPVTPLHSEIEADRAAVPRAGR